MRADGASGGIASLIGISDFVATCAHARTGPVSPGSCTGRESERRVENRVKACFGLACLGKSHAAMAQETGADPLKSAIPRLF
jgi:hypothetical protein